MIKAVIFDMDGLMFDTERVYMEAMDYAGIQCGYGYTGYMAVKTLGMNYEKTREEWYKEFGNMLDEKKMLDCCQKYIENHFAKNGFEVKKGLYELIEYLKENHIKRAVASSSPSKVVRKILKGSKIYEDFDAVIAGDMIQNSKPEPDIYLKACETIQEKPSECLALEDSKSGLLSAYKAGMKPVFVPDLWHGDKEIMNILYAKVGDLKQVVDLIAS